MSNNQHVNFTPREIVSELNRFIVGQGDAKKAVAVALRNRWRRLQVADDLREEITPKNIILIGPTGVGKTEIARRLAKLANAPFIKVEATKFTEVGYVGKDVESMIRELTDIGVNMVKEEEKAKVLIKAADLAEEKILDLLLPHSDSEDSKVAATPTAFDFLTTDATAVGASKIAEQVENTEAKAVKEKQANATREKFRKMLREGKLDDREVELDTQKNTPMPMIEVVAGGSLDEIGSNLKDMFSNFMPKSHGKRRKYKVKEALEIITQEEAGRLVDMENVKQLAIERVEQNGIVFLDEIDKIATPSFEGTRAGADVSRSGVQRDILPIVEGSNVSTKHGMVKTDHILFIAAGAFHMAKPSDLIPELQGRFPIRVELKALTRADFLQILTEPANSLTKQYVALMATEKIAITYAQDGLEQIAEIATQMNEKMENIGARRLHTIMEKVLEEISFTAPDVAGQSFVIDASFVKKQLNEIIQDQDLSRYIL